MGGIGRFAEKIKRRQARLSHPGKTAATIMLADLKMEDFKACLHQPFQIHLEERPSPLVAELTEVTALPHHGDGIKSRRPFSIILRNQDDVILPQRIYHVEHEKMGRLDLFLVPVGPDGEGMQYEALFT
jgi:hypothetical protein